MKLIIEENEQKMSESAMHILLGAMMQDKRVNISLTAGRSPINLYKMMVPYVKDQEKFKDIQYYLFDEAPYQDKPHGPNWEEMQELFFKDANIPDERIHTTTMENWETYDQEIRDIIECKKDYEEKFQRKIPVIVAGGIFDRKDIEHVMKLGADGVQIASRFVATEECDASDAYKQAYIQAEKKNIQIIQSPVGMPGRALRNEFIKGLETARKPITKCYNCLEKCDPRTVPYCITKALIEAVQGNVENGLIFCGENVDRIHEMTTVHDLMNELCY